MGDSAYSFSLTTFSPSGKLVQIEYAINAVQQRPTALGIKAANGVVVATEKKMPTTLIDETSVEKTALITENVGAVYSGLAPDFRVLVKKGMVRSNDLRSLKFLHCARTKESTGVL
jgi:20S proteasome subunit alpha 2